MSNKIKKIILLFCLVLSAAICGAHGTNSIDGQSAIQIKTAQVQGVPRGDSIEATINGHTLIVVFLDDLGQVAVEVSEVGGGETHPFNKTPMAKNTSTSGSRT